ncbi:MAG: GNAT family N-acetyltransferase [Acidimicrobiales bacterium]
MTGSLVIVPALISDVDSVVGVLDEAASWLAARRVEQWPCRFEPGWVEPDLVDGSTFLVLYAHDPIATITITESDPVWPDDDVRAHYLHRFAVRRSHAGVGAAVLDWADARAGRAGAHVLRLDCIASNTALRDYLEAAAFRRQGYHTVSGPSSGRDGSQSEQPTGEIVVATYERVVSTSATCAASRVTLTELPSDPEIDRAMADAWPPIESEVHSGWRLRFSGGVTRRANSVLTIGAQPDVEAVVDAAEAFYEERSATPTFLVSDASTPPLVPLSLAARGYRGADSTWMLVGTAAAVEQAFEPDDRWVVDVAGEPSESWLATYRTVQGVGDDPAWEQIVTDHLLRPSFPARFVTVREAPGAGEAVAVGQVVVGGGWGCLQCLATAPSGRRRGAATQAFRALATASHEAGAANVFAAVAGGNVASLRLCRLAGMRPSHRYRYFALP